MSKDRLGVPKGKGKQPPKAPKPKGLMGPLLSLIIGLAIGAALVFGFLHLRNEGVFDEWIEEYPFLSFLDDD